MTAARVPVYPLTPASYSGIPPRLSRRWRMRLSRAVSEYLADLRAAGRAKETLSAYASDLGRLVTTAGHDTVLNVTPDLLTRHFRDLSEANFSLSTLHRKTAVMREFVKWGRRQRLWGDTDPLLSAIPRIRRQEALPRPFSGDEVTRLWRLELSAEDQMLRALLFYTGLRATAVCNILVGNVSAEPPTIATLSKGGRTVLKPMHPQLAEIVLGYLRARPGLKPQSYLVPSPTGRQLHRRQLENRTRRWGEAANVLKCLPHRFRHTMATEMLRGGTDIRVISKALDHRDLKSTAVYTRVHDDQIEAAFHRLSWGPT